MELGLNGGGYNYNPDVIGLNMWTMGMSADFKVQPRLGMIEPYAIAGAGGYALVDNIGNNDGVGASLRLGLGADLRINNFALSARYLHSRYAFDGGPVDGSSVSNSLGLNFSFYF